MEKSFSSHHSSKLVKFQGFNLPRSPDTIWYPVFRFHLFFHPAHPIWKLFLRKTTELAKRNASPSRIPEHSRGKWTNWYLKNDLFLHNSFLFFNLCQLLFHEYPTEFVFAKISRMTRGPETGYTMVASTRRIEISLIRGTDRASSGMRVNETFVIVTGRKRAVCATWMFSRVVAIQKIQEISTRSFEL